MSPTPANDVWRNGWKHDAQGRPIYRIRTEDEARDADEYDGGNGELRDGDGYRQITFSNPPLIDTLPTGIAARMDAVESSRVALADFLPTPFVSDSTDVTAALQAWVVAAQAEGVAKGGVRLVAEPGIYRFTSVVSDAIGTLTGIDGVQLDCNGATFADQRAYGSAGARATLFRFNACTAIKGALRVTSEAQLDIPSGLPEGLCAAAFHQGCRGIDLDVEMIGGREAVSMIRVAADPVSYKSGDARLAIRTTDVFYPYSGQFSGDDTTAKINCLRPGRAFTLYGCRGVTLDVHNQDQSISAYIGMYDALGCEDIDVKFYDRDSTTFSAALIDLHYRGTVAATHKDIKVKFDTTIPHTCRNLRLMKTDDAAAYDTTGRGHVLDGLDVSGVSTMTGGSIGDHIGHSAFGEMVAPDVIRGLNFHDLILKGALGRTYFRASCLADVAHVDRVTCEYDFHVENEANSVVLHTASKATRFSRDVDDVHVYVGCAVTGALQQLGIGKVFLGGSGTNLAGFRPERVASGTAALESVFRDTADERLKYKDANGSLHFMAVPWAQTVTSDADFTLSAGAPTEQTFHTGTLTADRTITLGTSGAARGMRRRITRRGGGAFNLNVGSPLLKALATNQWCEVVHDGGSWNLAAFGSL